MKAEILSAYSPIVERETRIGSTTIVNFSDVPIGRAINFFPANLNAEKIVLMPDLNPARSPLPTGVSVEFDETRQPEWRKFAVSDVGCGMQLVRTRLNWNFFESAKYLWDDVYHRLKANKGGKGDLGSGNHFLDAAVDENEKLYFVIHTGSRKESSNVDGLINDPAEFDAVYEGAQIWAKDNRNKVRKALEEVYGTTEMIFDRPHNFYKKDGKKVVLYKGSVDLTPGTLTIIPSSMDSDIAVVSGKEPLSELNYTVAHGTGRIKSRGEGREASRNYNFDGLRKRIYIPQELENQSIVSETPDSYRTLDECLDQIKDLVEVRKILTPIAYMGQM